MYLLPKFSENLYFFLMEINRWDKFRFLTIGLIFSGALNIGLILGLVFSAITEDVSPVASPKMQTQEESSPSNRELLKEMLKLSFSELVASLTNRERLEDGYCKRDLALSCLVHTHFFNLEKALSSTPSQKRVVFLTAEQMVEMYPGLCDEQYEAIIRYAYQEKWPLTSKGLFSLLKKRLRPQRDPSLCQAFFMSPEFYQLKILFQKTDATQDAAKLLDLALEGPWELLDRFAKEQSARLDLSCERRRFLLFSYMTQRSSRAADLLLETDATFVSSRLEDEKILTLLDLLNEKSPAAERFCLDLLNSPRTDAVWKGAADKLYAFAQETPPLPFDRETALLRFSAAAPAQEKKATLQEHIVQDGETLWKIARAHKVKLEDLVEVNGLEKDRLVPGMVLYIPHGTGSEPPR
jgi:hypothetical protein